MSPQEKGPFCVGVIKVRFYGFCGGCISDSVVACVGDGVVIDLLNSPRDFGPTRGDSRRGCV